MSVGICVLSNKVQYVVSAVQSYLKDEVFSCKSTETDYRQAYGHSR